MRDPLPQSATSEPVEPEVKLLSLSTMTLSALPDGLRRSFKDLNAQEPEEFLALALLLQNTEEIAISFDFGFTSGHTISCFVEGNEACLAISQRQGLGQQERVTVIAPTKGLSSFSKLAICLLGEMLLTLLMGLMSHIKG